MAMKYSLYERLVERLKGALALVAIVFVVLFLAGGPDTSSTTPANAGHALIQVPAAPGWEVPSEATLPY